MNPEIKRKDEPFMKGSDSNGWWVFSAFRGDTYVKGIKIALGFGGPPSNKASFQFLIYTKDSKYPYYKMATADAIEAKFDKLDVSFQNLCKISGTWPNYTVYAKEPENDISVDLKFNAKTVQYWNGGKILYFNNFGKSSKWDIYYAAYHCETKAHFEIKGKPYDYTAIGDFEHLWGSALPGQEIDRLGYWLYEPLMWNDSFWVKDKGWTSVRDYIEEVSDFPIKGISFKDISPLLADETMFQGVIAEMGDILVKLPDYWIGIEARGFLFASALSIKFGGGVVMCRKAGKLPPPVTRKRYQLEYGTEWIEMKEGTGTAVIVDDVLATGGTLQATNDLAKMVGYDVIDNLVLIDLLYVPTVEGFNFKVKSLIQYE